MAVWGFLHIDVELMRPLDARGGFCQRGWARGDGVVSGDFLGHTWVETVGCLLKGISLSRLGGELRSLNLRAAFVAFRAGNLIAGAQTLVSFSNRPVASCVLGVRVTEEASAVRVNAGECPVLFTSRNTGAGSAAGRLAVSALDLRIRARLQRVGGQVVAVLSPGAAGIITAVLLPGEIPG